MVCDLSGVTVEQLGKDRMLVLRYDPQGKAHARMLMDFPVTVPKSWVDQGLVEAV